MTISSFMGLAAIYADDTIAEQPCPAEVGGFVIELAPAFHKIFANCGDTYVEIDTRADPYYDATGLGRFAKRGSPIELGPGMSFAAPMKKWGAPAISMAPGVSQPAQPVAVGPQWLTGDRWVSLASLSAGLTSKLNVVAESSDRVEFEVAYACPDNVQVVERYGLTSGRLRIDTCVRAGGAEVEQMRFIVPLLVSDGASKSEIRLEDGRAIVSYLGAALTVTFPQNVKATLDESIYANRNGLYRSLILERAGGSIGLALDMKEAGK
jgi:hypothetical protein